MSVIKIGNRRINVEHITEVHYTPPGARNRGTASIETIAQSTEGDGYTIYLHDEEADLFIDLYDGLTYPVESQTDPRLH